MIATIDKVGLLCIRDGRVLLCRKKRGKRQLILPGGKREPGETSLETLQRELAEEISGAQAKGLERIGQYRYRAAGSRWFWPKWALVELFRGELGGKLKASAEIAELVWFGERDVRQQLAPSLGAKIIPDLVRRGILEWDTWR